jgi:hypothetical protein
MRIRLGLIIAITVAAGFEGRGATNATQPCGTPLPAAVLNGVSVQPFSNAGDNLSPCVNAENPSAPEGEYGWQFECVELVRRFYDAPEPDLEQHFPAGARNQWPRLNAWQFFCAAQTTPSMQLQAFQNGATTVTPAVGDILVFGPDPEEHGSVGHVALVKGVIPGTITLVEQNFSATGTAQVSWSVVNSGTSEVVWIPNRPAKTGSFPVLGWLRSTVVASEPHVPTLLVDAQASDGRPIGQAFTFSGSMFTPNGSISRVVYGPDGSASTVSAALSADSSGNVTWVFQSDCSMSAGMYAVTATDVTTGLTSNVVTEILNANTNCTSVPSGLALVFDGSQNPTLSTAQFGDFSGRGINLLASDSQSNLIMPAFYPQASCGGGNCFTVISINPTTGRTNWQATDGLLAGLPFVGNSGNAYVAA